MARRRRRKTSKSKGILLLILFCVFCYLWFTGDEVEEPAVNTEVNQTTGDLLDSRAEDGLNVWYLDVGQGDSILLNCGESWMLVDTGSASAEGVSTGFMDQLGVDHLNYLVLTHPHEDHIGNASEVLQSVSVGAVYMTAEESDSNVYQNAMDLIWEQGLDSVIAEAGDVFYLDEASVYVVNPSQDHDDVNDDSLCLKVVYGDTSFLFTGDAEAPAEQDMADGYDISADVLKVGHHGSANSSIDEFLAAVRPSVAVISVGEDNSYDHPTEEALTRLSEYGADIYRTDESGTVYIHSDGNTLTIGTEK